MRRLLPLLILAALVLAPFGRIGAAEARPIGHHEAMQMAGHCADGPAPADGNRMPIDCMIACAAMTGAAPPLPMAPPAGEAAPAPNALVHLAGVRPEAEPPPPRIS